MSNEAHSAAEFLPDSAKSIGALRTAAEHCQGCHLFRHATQTVFGAGAVHAKVVFVGEQPGDQEDRQGRPFVGPAGRVLDEALATAGIDRRQVYVTNAVKHFKFTLQGKRRLHKKPGSRELAACWPWLEAELGLIKPQAVVCLGATAAQALLGRDFRITKQRGEWLESPWCPSTLATYHPSAILRAPAESQRDLKEMFLADLTKVRERLV